MMLDAIASQGGGSRTARGADGSTRTVESQQVVLAGLGGQLLGVDNGLVKSCLGHFECGLWIYDGLERQKKVRTEVIGPCVWSSWLVRVLCCWASCCKYWKKG